MGGMNPMPCSRDALIAHANDLLAISAFHDYAPNGLQIAGCDTIETIVTGVTASQALIDAACDLQADLLLVHHGYFWQNSERVITGIMQKRIKTLLTHNISLAGYHLPLDAHPSLGNNAQLAERCGFEIEAIHKVDGAPILFVGHLLTPMTISDWADQLTEIFERTPLCLSPKDKTKPISKIAWCSGGAQSYFEAALAYDIDAYLTGEASEYVTHLARESGAHFVSAGHHATERYGIQTLGAALAETFGCAHHFVDIDNPV